jgi:hypothetical protein
MTSIPGRFAKARWPRGREAGSGRDGPPDSRLGRPVVIGPALLREYIWLDGRPLAVVEGGQTYWLAWDQTGLAGCSGNRQDDRQWHCSLKRARHDHRGQPAFRNGERRVPVIFRASGGPYGARCAHP